MKKLLIKVCGMRDDANIRAVLALKPDFMGLICYPKSPRYVGSEPTPGQSGCWAPVQKVGVFVNASLEEIAARQRTFGFDCVQLHGGESAEDCRRVRELTGCRVLKAVSVACPDDVARAEDFAGVADYILFDTHTAGYGGSGKSFDWRWLDGYAADIPFFISGGLDIDALRLIKRAAWPQLAGVDLNSRFELSPGLKDIERLKDAFDLLREQ